MGYIVGMVFLAALLVLVWFAGPRLAAAIRENVSGEPPKPPPSGWVRGGALAVIGLVMALVTFLNSFHSVEAGQVGLVYSFGDITGQRDSGPTLTWPWQSLSTETVQVQTLCFMDETEQKKCPDGSRRLGVGLDSFSKETQNVYIDAIVNIQVKPLDVIRLRSEVGKDYVNKLIPGRVAQFFKDETVNYSAEELAPARDTIRENVEQALRVELNKFSIEVVALLVENIQFDQAFEDSLLARQTANIEADRQQALVAASEAQARQVSASALGAADKLRIEAQGQADANRAITASLTPLLVQWQAIQKLADDIKIALVPSGQGIIIDPTTLFGTGQP